MGITDEFERARETVNKITGANDRIWREPSCHVSQVMVFNAPVTIHYHGRAAINSAPSKDDKAAEADADPALAGIMEVIRRARHVVAVAVFFCLGAATAFASDYPRPPIGDEWILLQAEWALANEAWAMAKHCSYEKKNELNDVLEKAVIIPFLLTMEQSAKMLPSDAKAPPKDCSIPIWQIDRALIYFGAKAKERAVSGPPLPRPKTP